MIALCDVKLRSSGSVVPVKSFVVTSLFLRFVSVCCASTLQWLVQYSTADLLLLQTCGCVRVALIVACLPPGKSFFASETAGFAQVKGLVPGGSCHYEIGQIRQTGQFLFLLLEWRVLHSRRSIKM